MVDFPRISKCNLRLGCFFPTIKFWRKFFPFITIFLLNCKNVSLANFPLVFSHYNLIAKKITIRCTLKFILRILLILSQIRCRTLQEIPKSFRSPAELSEDGTSTRNKTRGNCCRIIVHRDPLSQHFAQEVSVNEGLLKGCTVGGHFPRNA